MRTHTDEHAHTHASTHAHTHHWCGALQPATPVGLIHSCVEGEWCSSPAASAGSTVAVPET